VQLFHSLKSHEPGDAEWDDLVAFLQEFCSLAKHLQLQHRQNLWNKMTQLGMFEVRRTGHWGVGCRRSVCARVV
jgi:protein phosphatase-4 regulatory subunit 3